MISPSDFTFMIVAGGFFLVGFLTGGEYVLHLIKKRLKKKGHNVKDF